MSIKFRYDKSKLRDSEDYYKTVELSPIQYQITVAIAKLHAESLGIIELSSRGLCAFTIGGWQLST